MENGGLRGDWAGNESGMSETGVWPLMCLCICAGRRTVCGEGHRVVVTIRFGWGIHGQLEPRASSYISYTTKMLKIENRDGALRILGASQVRVRDCGLRVTK